MTIIDIFLMILPMAIPLLMLWWIARYAIPDPISRFARGYSGIKWYHSRKKKLELLEEARQKIGRNEHPEERSI